MRRFSIAEGIPISGMLLDSPLTLIRDIERAGDDAFFPDNWQSEGEGQVLATSKRNCRSQSERSSWASHYRC
jgi:hypothetical protein